MNSTLSQPYTFLIFLYGGIVTGILYDLCALLRELFSKLNAHTAADILFSILFFLTLTATFFYATACILRLFGFLTMLLGILLEQQTVSKLLLPAHIRRAMRGQTLCKANKM